MPRYKYKKFIPARAKSADIVAALFVKVGDIRGVGPNIDDNRTRCPKCKTLFRAHGKYAGQVICPGTVFIKPLGDKTAGNMGCMPKAQFDEQFEAVK